MAITLLIFLTMLLTFQAIDREKHIVETQLGIHVKILDANDNAPEFDRKIYEISVNESKLQGSDLITIKAIDKDISSVFNVFDIRMVSVQPKDKDVELYLTQIPNTDTATISFKGCLDYETVNRYTIILEAKDRGKPQPMSSTCTVIINIVDGNNHLPEITQQKGLTKVKENEKDVLIFRVPVKDGDAKGTPAWRAKYNIIGDKNKHFRISTDPQTNDGLLYVQKSLNYEETDMVNITITAENETPFYDCKVLERSTTDLWKIFYEGETSTSGTNLMSQHVSVMVENVNEAPMLKDKKVSVNENSGNGKQLAIFAAQDPDLKKANTIKYIIGKDPAGWIKVDANSGKVTTSANIDRESSFVNNSIYIASILAVDNGIPPMTGTGTLTIQITDENDNAPFLVANSVDMCHSDPISRTKISASDLDLHPNAGPFVFVLLEDAEGSWRVDPSTGHSVDLIKENHVHSGIYDLSLEVSDLQGNTDIQRLTVTVCNCLDLANPNCSFRKSAGSTLGAGAILIMILSLLLLAGLLLLVLLFTCKKEKKTISDDSSGHLMNSNTEEPGSDCTVSFGSNLKATAQAQAQTAAVNSYHMNGAADYGLSKTDSALHQETQNIKWTTNDEVREGVQLQRQRSLVRNSLHSSMGRGPQRMTWNSGSVTSHRQQLQSNHLYKMLHGLQAPGNELLDYVPKMYADEGTFQPNFDLDALTISEVSFNLDSELDLKFQNLASICMPRKTSAFHTVTGQRET
ncbi:cadherin-2A-like isoform X2 [Gouania willdenowi]|uniref:cadherin-2A-like isoform X2 n=1 Tax=Gouania willdenowi TaxID=441366 RepID=UPI00105636BF|nr:cadherin-2A-like isoform X2 [Gouania willdenowi]